MCDSIKRQNEVETQYVNRGAQSFVFSFLAQMSVRQGNVAVATFTSSSSVSYTVSIFILSGMSECANLMIAVDVSGLGESMVDISSSSR